jgi:CRISPR/Cas system-associated endonuclease Cas3-HD
MIFIEDINTDNLISGEPEENLGAFYELKNTFENNAWHSENVFDHTISIMSVYEKFIADKNENTFLHSFLIKFLRSKIDTYYKFDLFRLVILFHDIGKNDTIIQDKSGFTSCPNHEEISFLKTKLLINKFNISSKAKEYVLRIIRSHGIIHKILDDTSTAGSILKEEKKKFINIYPDLLLFCMLDTVGSQLKNNKLDNYNERITFYKNALIEIDTL